MCKGTVKEKAEFLFDIALGPEGVKQEKESIAWKSGRMVSAFKKLIFYSEIFPKKYQSEFYQELVAANKPSINKRNQKGNSIIIDPDEDYAS